jgi:hypothetical protein
MSTVCKKKMQRELRSRVRFRALGEGGGADGVKER